MNHLTALAITITAFSSGLYGIYKFVRAKYVSYDTTPIRYWLDKPSKIKKRYKTFKNRNKKRLITSKKSRQYKYSKSIINK
jgi:hypothetical protein